MTGVRSGTIRKPDDQAARDRISSVLDRTLFVEAGAGSGKTTALVQRVLALVGDGVPMESIAAITFTEKAAAELRDRIRQKLEESRHNPTGTIESWDAELALQQLDSAAVGTLHSFAQRILADHPVEAGLPPDVGVLDEIASQIEFDRRWRAFVDSLLDDTTMSDPLLTLEVFEVKLTDIRALAKALDENWDELEHYEPGSLINAEDRAITNPADEISGVLNALWRLLRYRGKCHNPTDKLLRKIKSLENHLNGLEAVNPATSRAEIAERLIGLQKGCNVGGAGNQNNWRPPTFVEQARQAAADLKGECRKLRNRPVSAIDPTTAVNDVVNALWRLLEFRGKCYNPSDKLLKKIEIIGGHLNGLEAVNSATSRDSLLKRVSSLEKNCNVGRMGTNNNWRPPTFVKQARQAVADLKNNIEEALDRLARVALSHLTDRLAKFILDSAKQRQEGGQLEFHDLLVGARRLLRHRVHGKAARTALRRRYQRLLLDEFQDTDPIQIELAVLLASDPYKDSGEEHWSELSCESGRLFFVGDPKQSIYRFRRADIATYLEARDYVAENGGDIEILTTNFRCAKPLIEWVNEVFERLIEPSEGSQPDYTPLNKWRGSPPKGPAVTVLGAEQVEIAGAGQADALRAFEAESVADMIVRILEDQWCVNHGKNDQGEDIWRAAKPSDIAILIPARTSLAALEDALESAGIPYRAESSSLVYNTREVRDSLIALQAIADPADELALVAALRSPLYGCGDDDLADWKLGAKGRFSLIKRVPDDAPEDHPVARAMAHLRELRDAKRWESPAQLLDRLIRERGAYETAVATGRPRDVWRRLRYVVDQARAWADAGGTDLRSYLEWARMQGAENARVTETILPETDDDSVRILTVHASKGLEFPIAILSGMSSKPQSGPRGPSVAFPADKPPVIRLKKGVQSGDYEKWKKSDFKLDADEKLRMLYVACTRARDHLVISLFRTKKSARSSNAGILAGAGDVTGVDHFEPAYPLSRYEMPDSSDIGGAEARLGWSDWRSELTSRLERASVPTVISATELVKKHVSAGDHSSLDKDRRSTGESPWLKGRYGTAVGRAVHAVLQTVDLASGNGLEDEAKRQADAESVPEKQNVVTALARAALGTPAAKQAAKSQHWRELFVSARISDDRETLLEGYIDLMYRDEENRLVIVDWKTDVVEDDADKNARLNRYRLQGACYSAMVEAVTGETVARMEFVFLGRNTEPVIAAIPDLRSAIEEVKQNVAKLAPTMP